MKLAHIADLHIGKKLNDFSLIDNQCDVLRQIVDWINRLNLDGIMIAGDVYDTTFPTIEAVELLDEFLTELSELKVHIFIIGGNHDSQQRLSFGARILEKSAIHISSVFNGNVDKVVLSDEYGDLNFYLLPYIRPIHVRKAYEDFKGEGFTEAIRYVLNKINPDISKRNILICHQFVTGAATSESEEIYVGGSENVDFTLFDKFDYVALGHLHKPQFVGRETVRYAGTPLKYSFSEAGHTKTMTVVDIREKGSIHIEEMPLEAKQDLLELKGSFTQLTSPEFRETVDRNAFIRVTLTDETIISNGISELRKYYPYILSLGYDNSMTRHDSKVKAANISESLNPLKMVEDLFRGQNNREMNEAERKIVTELVDRVWRHEYEAD